MNDLMGVGREDRQRPLKPSHAGSIPAPPAINVGVAQLAEPRDVAPVVVGSTPTPHPKQRGYAAVGLMNPKTGPNIGGVARAIQIYGAAMLVIEGDRFRRIPTDTMKAYRHVPVIDGLTLRDAIPYDCVPVAVELVPRARSLVTYKHPERAFYLFGPEDSSLGARTLEWCRDVIYIPTSACMNLAACVNVVLYDRMAKQYSTYPE